jgi:hypothetical protein
MELTRSKIVLVCTEFKERRKEFGGWLFLKVVIHTLQVKKVKVKLSLCLTN